jgi:hydrogenase maturation protein HypF
MLHQLRSWDAATTYHLPDEALMEPLIDRPQFSPSSTSAGRLFDAVAALVLPDPAMRHGNSGYEGHFAAMLEDLCDTNARGAYPFPLVACEASSGASMHQPHRAPSHALDWRPLLRGVVRDLQAGVSPADMAMRFHRALAIGIRRVSDLYPNLPVVLGGGVFQNKVLVELLQEQLGDREVAFPGEIPVNDGGLAAGQLAILCAQLEQESCA